MNLLMSQLFLQLRRFFQREEGQDLIEYALIAALIALAATVAIQGIGTQLGTVFNNISTTLENAFK